MFLIYQRVYVLVASLTVLLTNHMHSSLYTAAIFHSRISDVTVLTFCIIMVLFTQPRLQICKHGPKIEASERCRDGFLLFQMRGKRKIEQSYTEENFTSFVPGFVRDHKK